MKVPPLFKTTSSANETMRMIIVVNILAKLHCSYQFLNFSLQTELLEEISDVHINQA